VLSYFIYFLSIAFHHFLTTKKCVLIFDIIHKHTLFHPHKVEIEASITVTSITPTTPCTETTTTPHTEESCPLSRGGTGFDVQLSTKVSRVRDDIVIAEGTHDIWIPDYMHM